MAHIARKTLLSLVAACVAQGVAFAQDAQESFLDAVRMIRKNEVEEGLAKLRAAVEADPSSEEAFELWKAANAAHGVDVWDMLLAQGGEFATLARTLIDRATLGRDALSRDDAAIAALVEASQSDDFATRNQANAALAADHGEFAVPHLIQILADSDSGREADLAMVSVLRIGRPAVLPLIEALKSGNALLRRNAASALGRIGDRRAGASLAVLANDPIEGVRAAAAAAMKALGARSGAASGMLVEEAKAYLDGADTAVDSAVVWTFDPATGNVTPSDVPAGLYSLELAKMRALDALTVDPRNGAAIEVLGQAYLAQNAKLDSDPDVSAAADSQGGLQVAAMAIGFDTGRAAAMAADLEAQSSDVDGSAEDLGVVEGDTIGDTPLADALGSSETSVRYAAALSMARKESVPAAGRVVSVLAEAATEEALRAVLVIDSDPTTLAAAAELAAHRGYAVRAVADGKEGVATFYGFPAFDIVFVSENAKTVDATSIAGLVKKRSESTKVVLLTRSEDAESAFEGKVDGVLMPEEDAAGFAAAQFAATTEEMVESLEDRRARADVFARAAADALSRVAASGASITAAAGALAGQLDRDDSVAVPAARALGAAGNASHAAGLVETMTREGASDDLKKACADALGAILARSGEAAQGPFAQLFAVAADKDASLDVRQAAAHALGQARLGAAERLRVAEVLHAIATGDA